MASLKSQLDLSHDNKPKVITHIKKVSTNGPIIKLKLNIKKRT